MSRKRGRLKATNQYALPSCWDATGTKPEPGGETTNSSPYRIVNATSDDTADVYLMDEIGGWGIWAGEFAKELSEITAPNIRLHVNSPGGSVFDGLAIMAAIADHPATVTAIIDGLAASAASFIVQAADKITIGRQSKMMIHDAAGAAYGNAADMLEMADLLDNVSADIASIYAEASGTPAAGWREKMRAETWYTGAEAVDAGLADEIATPRTRTRTPDTDNKAPVGLGASSSPEKPEPAPVAVMGDWFDVIDFDTLTGTIRDAVVDARDGYPDIDPDEFRGMLSAFADDMPATPTPPEPTPSLPVPVEDTTPAGSEPRKDDDKIIDPGDFRALLETVANNMPAPPTPTPQPTPKPNDDPVLDRLVFIEGLREALR